MDVKIETNKTLDDAKTPQDDAQKKVTEALAEAQKIMDDANAKVMAAEAALASKCAVEWDKKNKKVREITRKKVKTNDIRGKTDDIRFRYRAPDAPWNGIRRIRR
jgi:hypothetical protein